MRKALLVLLVCVFGCDQNSLKRTPKIEVEIQDNTENTKVIVSYRNHNRNYNETCEYLNTVEELQHYKNQVEFLLKRLDEAETKMKIHEPENEKK